MAVEMKEELSVALKTAGLGGEVALLAMHLSEIEEEAGQVLDLLTALRAHSHRGDVGATQESLAELSIALEHLVEHAGQALPEVQKRLEIDPE